MKIDVFTLVTLVQQQPRSGNSDQVAVLQTSAQHDGSRAHAGCVTGDAGAPHPDYDCLVSVFTSCKEVYQPVQPVLQHTQLSPDEDSRMYHIP